MKELWKAIPGYGNSYEVSNLGRVRSSARGSLRILKAWPRGDYLAVHLGSHATKNIHALVAEAFIGPRLNGFTVSHIDGNPHNNRLGNLEYATQKNNLARQVQHGTRLEGIKHPKSKVTEAIVKEIRERRGLERQIDLAKRFGISQTAVGRIQLRKTWDHV